VRLRIIGCRKEEKKVFANNKRIIQHVMVEHNILLTKSGAKWLKMPSKLIGVTKSRMGITV
jgi:hypothetical protein